MSTPEAVDWTYRSQGGAIESCCAGRMLVKDREVVRIDKIAELKKGLARNEVTANFVCGYVTGQAQPVSALISEQEM